MSNYSDRNKKVIIILLVILAGVLIFLAFYFNAKNKKTNNNIQSNKTISRKKHTNSEPHLLTKKENNYHLVNLSNGRKIKKVIPNNYEVIGFRYNESTKYLILKRNNFLYAYNLKTDTINKIENLKLEQREKIKVFPSISEAGNFLISLSKFNSNTPHSAEITRRIIFNADRKKIQDKIKQVRALGCAKYDSKFNRIFSWCGVHAGSTLPLNKEDLDGSNRKELATLSDFGLNQSEIQKISVDYYEQSFILLKRDNYSRIDVINAEKKGTERKSYSINSNIQNKLKTLTPNRTIFSRLDNSKSVFIIGGHDKIALLKQSNNDIKQVKLIKEKNFSTKRMFIQKNKLFYISDEDKSIKTIDLNNLKVRNLTSIKPQKAITIINL